MGKQVTSKGGLEDRAEGMEDRKNTGGRLAAGEDDEGEGRNLKTREVADSLFIANSLFKKNLNNTQ